MPYRQILMVLFLLSFFALQQPSLLSAAEQYGWIHGRYYGPIPYYVGNPRSIEITQTGSAVFPERKIQSYPSLQGEASPHAYPYGYFVALNIAHIRCRTATTTTISANLVFGGDIESIKTSKGTVPFSLTRKSGQSPDPVNSYRPKPTKKLKTRLGRRDSRRPGRRSRTRWGRRPIAGTRIRRPKPVGHAILVDQSSDRCFDRARVAEDHAANHVVGGDGEHVFGRGEQLEIAAENHHRISHPVPYFSRRCVAEGESRG